jgi:hypothetical protein
MKEDELALRFDTMTLGMFPVQIMRIIQNALRRSNDSGMNGLDERYAVAATIAFLSPRIRKTGSMVWSESLRRSAHSSSKPSTASMNSLTFALSLIAVSWTRLATLHIMQFPPTAVFFGGPKSPENLSDWDNSWDSNAGQGAFEYRALPLDWRTDKMKLADEARDEFLEKSKIIPWEADNLEGIARHLGLDL